MSNKQKELEKRYQFQTEYIKNVEDFKSKLFEKKLVPYQVEFQSTTTSKKKYVG